MPKFVITISVDAHVHYSTVVEADTAELAKQFAREHEDDLKWHDVGRSEYDDRDWDNIEPEEVDDAFLQQMPGLGPVPRHPACSRNPESDPTSSSAANTRTPSPLMALFGELDTFIEQ